MSAKENWSKATHPPEALPPAEPDQPAEPASAAAGSPKATAETAASAEAPLTPQRGVPTNRKWYHHRLLTSATILEHTLSGQPGGLKTVALHHGLVYFAASLNMDWR